MNLSKIVNRPFEQPITQDESLFVIKEYIKTRTGKDIKPEIETRFGIFNTHRELSRMISMTNYAIGWFRNNPNKIQ